MSWPWSIRYPVVNNEIQNLDWTLDEVKKFGERLDGIAEGILAEANKYTDEQLANYQTQIEEIRAEFTRLVDEVENDFDNLKIQINQSLLQMELKLIDLQQQLAADINAVNARTDLAIEQNNEYLISHMAEELSKIKVLNYFTGEYISIQDMFDYLARLHATDAITVSDLVSRQKDVNTLVALNMTMTQLAMNGANIIPA